jgi:hypothetical protein
MTALGGALLGLLGRASGLCMGCCMCGNQCRICLKQAACVLPASVCAWWVVAAGQVPAGRLVKACDCSRSAVIGRMQAPAWHDVWIVCMVQDLWHGLLSASAGKCSS